MSISWALLLNLSNQPSFATARRGFATGRALHGRGSGKAVWCGSPTSPVRKGAWNGDGYYATCLGGPAECARSVPRKVGNPGVCGHWEGARADLAATGQTADYHGRPGTVQGSVWTSKPHLCLPLPWVESRNRQQG